MKNPSVLASLLMLLAVSGLAEEKVETRNQLAADAVQFLRADSAVSFRYVVSTGFLAAKTVEYKRKGSRFCYKWVSPNGEDIVKSFCFDGDRYYSLQDKGALQVSSNPSPHSDFARSWFLYNPIYNPFRHLIGNLSPFLPAGFAGTEMSNQLMSQLARYDPKTRSVEIKGEDVFVQLVFSDKAPLPCFIYQWNRGLGELTWTAEDYVALPGSGMMIPAKIVCRETDLQGKEMPSSYSINLDKKSLQVLGEEVADSDFRVPMTAARSVYDADKKVHLKRED